MSVINSQPLIGASGNQGAAYNLTRSLRFRSSASAWLSRTPASTTNQQKYTLSTWVKRGQLGAYQDILNSYVSTNNIELIRFFNDDTFELELFQGSFTYQLKTTQVFRDPSAWYHIVVAYDTTQATASNRIKVYVNGVQVTSFSISTYPSQNANLFINRNVAHSIGVNLNNGNNSYFDGYLAEFNFIDGQQLDASSFGETDTATGVWKPKKYTGTYGTNGFYLPFTVNSTSSYAASFNGSNQYLTTSGNPAAVGTNDFTVEFWMYLNSDPAGYTVMATAATNGLWIGKNSGNFVLRAFGIADLVSSASLPKVNQWTHIAISRTSGVAKIFLNGIEQVSTSTSHNFVGGTFAIGNDGTSNWTNGRISNLRIVNGTGLYTANFTPATANLTAVTNTSLLTFQNSTIVDNSTNAYTFTNNGSVTTSVEYPFTLNIAADASGNNNNWTPNNISLVNGATYDSMKDVPTLTDADTANYATLNPLDVNSSASNRSITNGNLSVSISGTWNGGATMGVTSGKYYCEYTLTANIDSYIGIDNNFATVPTAYRKDGTRFNGSSWVSYGATYTTGDVIGMAFDATNNTIEYFKNGTSQGQITGVSYGSLVRPFFYGATGAGFNVNFGQRPFAYTPPSGFVALNTFNLPTPTIGATASTQANKYMDATTYTGNGTSQSIVNAGGFKPDFVWVKSRSLLAQHVLVDSVRGANGSVMRSLFSALTNVEDSSSSGPDLQYGLISSINSNGFSVNTGSSNPNQTNASNNTYVGWQWRASNETGVSNTSGSITSTVSANTTAGFSIVTYTGTGSNATVGHGLGVAPSMIIVRNRSITQNFIIGHTSLWDSNLNSFLLFTNSGTSTNSAIWNGTRPTSTTISIGTDSGTNGNGNSHVAWCWSEVAGFSKFGIFTGNGSTDNVFTYTGFRPKFVMIKATTGTDNWFTLDSTRNPFNVANSWLSPNLANVEGADNFFDFLSNGFKMRLAGNTPYIYAAFAETPFKYSLAR